MKLANRAVVGISIYLITALISGGAAMAVLIALAIRAFAGPMQCFQCLSLLALTSVLDFEVFPPIPGFAGLRFVILGLCFGAAITACRYNAWTDQLIRTHTATLFALAVLSAVGSYSPLISLMKLASFGVGSLCCLIVCRSPRIQRSEMYSWLASLFFVVCAASMLSLGLGVGSTLWGFQGFFTHPNTLALFVAINLGWLFTIAISSRRSWLELLMLGTALAIIILTKARGPFVAFAVAMLAFGFFGLLSSQEWRARFYKLAVNKLTAFTVIALSCYLFFSNGSQLLDKAIGFTKKDEASLIESVDDRISGLHVQLQNIKNHPLVGIGFGIHSNPEWWIRTSGDITYDPWLGLPIGASIEKGTILLALVEENGIIGAIVIAVTFVTYLRSIFKHGDALSLLLFLSALSVNLSEFVLCSVGQVGLFGWLAIGVSLRSTATERRTLKMEDTAANLSTQKLGPSGRTLSPSA